MKASVMFAALLACGVANSADRLVVELSSRLASSDVAAVNEYLSRHWETKMAPLGRLVRACKPEALRLSLRLLETTNLEALQGHVFSLELAMGRCPEKILPQVPSAHVKSLCAVNAFAEIHPGANLVAELDSRLRTIRKLDRVANSPKGRECIAALLEAMLRAKQEPGGRAQ